jgi:hypothetical protein
MSEQTPCWAKSTLAHTQDFKVSCQKSDAVESSSDGDAVALHAFARLFRPMTTIQARVQSFGDTVANHRPYLYRLALLQLHDKAAVEDVVHETLLAALATRDDRPMTG